MAANTKYDATLNEILREHTGLGGELKFVNTVFSFMARHSKLFLSPQIEKQISALAKKQSRVARKAHKQRLQQQEEQTAAGRGSSSASAPSTSSKPAPSTPLVSEQPKKSTKPAPIPSDDEPMKIEVVSDDEGDTPSSTVAPPSKSSSGDTPAEIDMTDDENPPVGNGGKTDKYVWTQTLEQLEVSFQVPAAVRGKDCEVKFTPTRLYVGLRGQEPLVDGEYPKESEIGDCQWSLGSDAHGKTLTVEIGKKDKMGWWPCVVKGDPSIDVQKIRPENSKVDNLDPETQRMVRKMMFDNNQKMMGKPTSDDQRKLDALESFKKQHPEFDFSNAKMS